MGGFWDGSQRESASCSSAFPGGKSCMSPTLTPVTPAFAGVYAPCPRPVCPFALREIEGERTAVLQTTVDPRFRGNDEIVQRPPDRVSVDSSRSSDP